ncbi:MAG: PDZ domain-containing protein [Dermatophilaceae bacterium]
MRLRPYRQLITAVAVLTLVVLAGMLVHPAYVVLRAGPAYNTLGELGGEKILQIKGATTYPTEGELTFTTVAVYGGPGRELTLWDYLVARAQPGSDIRPRAEYYPQDATRDQIDQQNQVQMATSQQEAVAIALRAAGHEVPEKVTVGQVTPGGPSDGRLKAGDVVVSVNGTPITRSDTLRGTISASAEGATVHLVVTRDGRQVPVQVGTTLSQGRRVIGVLLGTSFTFPFEVTIHATDVGGPSAGLMFALGVYDEITPGSLTGGQDIAGTGTIADDGSVGPIGGIEHKMVGARASGAAWFLAPADNCSEVPGRAPDGLRVVKVDTFDVAQHAVEEIAAGRGAALPTC